MRQLASIQRITNITPIVGGDRVELAQILGWQVVIAKKDNFKVGDLVVYLEIDSICPERPEFEFLRETKFRIKTRKFLKTTSQGLVMPLSILNNGMYDPKKILDTHIEGEDVTEVLGVKKYDSQALEEASLESIKHRSKTMQFLMKFAPVRKVYFFFNSKEKGNWPQWIQKTDEERIQTCAKILINNMENDFSISEKLDGQSGTFFLHKGKKWGFPVWEFGVCSRNLWLKTPNNSNYWKIAKSLSVEKNLRKLGKEIVVQGEILNTNVQKNKYKVTEPEFYVFTVVLDGIRLSNEEAAGVAHVLGLRFVPLIHRTFNPRDSFGDITEVKDIVERMVRMSIGKTALPSSDTQREGIVCRLVDVPKVSFKVINPGFLLKYDE